MHDNSIHVPVAQRSVGLRRNNWRFPQGGTQLLGTSKYDHVEVWWWLNPHDSVTVTLTEFFRCGSLVANKKFRVGSLTPKLLLAASFSKLGSILHQSFDSSQRSGLEFQYHECGVRIVFVIQAKILCPGKPKARVVAGVAQNDDGVAAPLST